MKIHLLTFALLVSSTFAFARPQAADAGSTAPGELTMLRLYDGAILWGSIEDADAQALHFARLDNGGKVRVPWARLDPQLADELMEKYGFIDHSGEELMIEADRLVLVDGSEVIGRIVNRTENELWVKTAEMLQPVPKLKLRGAPTSVQVPALDVFTREELYSQEASKLDPASAQSLHDLAVYSERIFDFTHAVEHLKAIQTLDPNFKPAEVAAALTRNERKVADQVQIDALRDIDQLRKRSKFDEAEKACDAFLTQYATSALKPDATKKKLQIVKARERYLAERTVDQWHSWLNRLTQAAGRDPKMTLESALAFVEEQLAQQVLQKVHEDLQRFSPSVTPDQVTKYWKERKGGRWHKVGFGHGTWLLGDSEARKGLEPEKKDDKPLSETDAARAKIEERYKRFLQNQEIVKKAANANEEEESEQELFWLEYSATSRGHWMLAHYVENSSDMQKRPPSFTNCPDCGGTGVREILNLAPVTGENQAVSSPSQLVNCPTCHHVGVFRFISYR